MRVKINTKKKEVRLIAVGKEKKIFTIITAFAGDAVIYPVGDRGKITKLITMFIDKIVIDLQHPSISKEFVQLLLRMKK